MASAPPPTDCAGVCAPSRSIRSHPAASAASPGNMPATRTRCAASARAVGVCVSTWRSAGLTAPELVVPEALSGVFRAPRGSWLAHVNRELGEVAALRAPSTSGVVSSPHLLSSLGGRRGPSWLKARIEKTLRPGGSREPLDPPYFYGSRTSLFKLSIPVLAALRARCGRWCSPARSRSLLLACLAFGLYMYI